MKKKAPGLNAGGGEEGGVFLSTIMGWGRLRDSGLLLCRPPRLRIIINAIAMARKTANMTPTAIPAFAPEERVFRERG